MFGFGLGDLLFSAKWVSFQKYHGENKLHLNKMVMMCTLYQTNILTGSSLQQQVDMSLCSQTFTAFHASQSILLITFVLTT